MTTTLRREPTVADEILEAVAALAPAVRARAGEVEEARRLPADLLDELSAAGCFRVLLPTSHGGAGAAPSDALRMYEELSRADASVGWTTMVGSGVWLDLVGLPRATFDGLYRAGPDVLVAGAFNPTGVAVPVDGAYRVSGRWAFASGCSHSQWLYGNCVEDVDGTPQLRTVLFSSAEVEIEDTWYVLGMRGTGSHHFSVDNVVVPGERTCPTLAGEPALDDPIVRIPVPSLLAAGIAAIAIGTAQGALDEVAEVAVSKTPLLAGSSLADQPLFRRNLATADTELRAARSLVHDVIRDAWSTACSGAEVSLEQRARMRAAAVWGVSRAATAVQTAYQAGGGSAVYDDSPLQRRLRDIHTITQHFLVRPDTMTTAGAVLVGGEVDVPVF